MSSTLINFAVLVFSFYFSVVCRSDRSMPEVVGNEKREKSPPSLKKWSIKLKIGSFFNLRRVKSRNLFQ